jgi:hypothetical protein
MTGRDQPGRAMAPARYKALLKRWGLTQEGAGVFLGYGVRSGQNMAARFGPPPPAAMLFNLMVCLDLTPADVEWMMRNMAPGQQPRGLGVDPVDGRRAPPRDEG